MAEDRAICERCRAEVLDPEDRRSGYILNHCPGCGPAFTIQVQAPFRRQQSTMAPFPPCERCVEERDDESNRRFAFEGISCPNCGPAPRLVCRDRIHLGQEALRKAASLLREGKILALKGTGGFLLAADACNAEAVARLRRGKERPHKAFAVMARDLSWIERVAELGPEDALRLQGPERPILLLRRKGQAVAAEVAPGLGDLGLFLPSTALQILLLEAGPPLQVMTSANRSGEPIAKENDEGLHLLGPLADGILLHDRAIHTHADDSVFRCLSNGAAPIPIRRSRGYVPKPFPLLHEAAPLLAVGGQEKNTVCLAAGGLASLSPHLGDLDQPKAWQRFLEAIEKLQRWRGEAAVAVAHDLHPDYRSSHWARESGLPCIPVQHHHAHIAACLAENRHPGPVIGVAFDGTGYGSDGSLWGGEFLLADLAGFRRLAHLRPLTLPGGSAAIQAPWRLALAAILDAGEDLDVLEAPQRDRDQLAALLQRANAFPRSTGAGRWFDAAAALCGVGGTVSYEGQAAAEFESLVGRAPLDPYPFDLAPVGEAIEVDLRACIRAMVRDRREKREISLVAGRFHETLARVVQYLARRLSRSAGVDAVALVGGCFQNRILTERCLALLEAEGLRVLLPREVPQNDGGLSYGQAVVASHRLWLEAKGAA